MRRVGFCVVLALSGCGAPPPAPPTAVVRAEPATVCLDDDHRTRVLLSAADSSTGLVLVPTPSDSDALSFSWAFSGAEHHELGRDPRAVDVLVTSKADRPLHVELTVENEGGGSATSLFSLPVTIPQRCEACASGETCLAGACVPERACDGDADCGDPCAYCIAGRCEGTEP
jgi:hypothetical protein